MGRGKRRRLLDVFLPQRGRVGVCHGRDPRLKQLAAEVKGLGWRDEAHSGRRAAAEAIWSSIGRDREVFVLRGKDGRLLEACDCRSLADGTLYVNNIGSSGARGGTGKELMRAVAATAASRGSGVRLTAFKESRSFYLALGMEQEPWGLNFFRFSPEEARRFAG